MSEGKIGRRVSRRRGDYLKSFEDEFNNMINAVNMRSLEITNLSLKNFKIIDELKVLPGDKYSKETINIKLAEIRDNLEKIENLSFKNDEDR